MLLQPGEWLGRGSLRPANAATGTPFTARIQVTDEAKQSGAAGWLLDATLQLQGHDARLLAWVAADEVGTYAVSLRGEGMDAQGTAKLDSEPHLGLLWDDAGAHIAFAVFVLRDSHGIRGFRRRGEEVWTWELALQPGQRQRGAPQPGGSKGKGRTDNVISLAAHRRR